MKLKDALLISDGKLYSIVGGGGKTSLISHLSMEVCATGYPCVIMTSTQMYVPSPSLAKIVTNYSSSPCRLLEEYLSSPVVVAIGSLDPLSGKLSFPPQALFQKALERANYILVEADGSRHLPIKAPLEHEPVLVEPSSRVIGVAGLSALGKPLSQCCHRPDRASLILGVPKSTVMTPALLAALLTSPHGQFKNVGDPNRYSVFLNQADNRQLCQAGLDVSYHIRQKFAMCPVVIGALRSGFWFSS